MVIFKKHEFLAFKKLLSRLGLTRDFVLHWRDCDFNFLYVNTILEPHFNIIKMMNEGSTKSMNCSFYKK